MKRHMKTRIRKTDATGCIHLKWTALLCAMVCLISLSGSPQKAGADEESLFNVTYKVQPNVLLVLDNSNSMDEAFNGDANTSWVTGSRSVEGRRALINLVTTYADTMRIGLMTFRLPAASKYYLHNSPYLVSYEPKSYCPNPPAACDTYCRTGDGTAQTACQNACGAQNAAFDATYRDEIITNYNAGDEPRNRYCNLAFPKTNRMINPSDLSNYIYYKIPGTFYNGGNAGTRFCYAAAYNSNDNTSSNYACYGIKTGKNDDNNNYASYSFSGSFFPTDEDVALGFRNFGRRMYWYPTGQTWFANGSPGGGYLHVASDTNGNNDAQKNALLAKLATKENDEAGYMSCNNTGNPNACPYVVNAGLTPTAGTFRSVVNYFKSEPDYQSNVAYTTPIQEWCQKNFVVYVTDGLPSVNEGGGTDTATNLMPGVLSRIDALRAITKSISGSTYTFDINTYILGMALTADSRPHLDNMAIHGGTDVNGSAYYANDPASLITALNQVFSGIVEKSYSFSTASVSSSRLMDENFLYEASFLPLNNDPFWKGSLRKFNINNDGTIGSTAWNSGEVLRGTDASARHIYTYTTAGITRFSTDTFSAPACGGYCSATSVTAAQLGVADAAARDQVVGYFRGDPAYNPDNWKLGDIYHSNPITIGTPSPYFYDHIDTGTPNGFNSFRNDAAHLRTSANGRRLIIAGANDGQFHAFKASDGSEYWSFIPPNVLSKLQYVSHTADTAAARAGKSHLFFVDGPVVAADVWLGSGSGTTKSSSDWRTLAIFSVGRNDRDYTTGAPAVSATKYWSSSSACDVGLHDTFHSVHAPYYCGYWAFDFTGVTASLPTFKWRMNPNAAQAPYFGEPWSKVAIGRVLVNGDEKWVGFIGGGYNPGECTGGSCTDKPGKGFFVVDLSNGNILWSYKNSDNSNMEYSIAAPPTVVDTDMDGFVDRAYVGDLGGNMWQFNFCNRNSPSSCTYSSWTGGLLLSKVGGGAQSGKQPIYTAATMSKDNNGNLWLYWGTGDKVDPTGNTPAGFFWGVKVDKCVDNSNNPSPCSRNDFDNISASGASYTDTAAGKGYYINLSGSSEKILADPVVFGGVVYFTTYTPGAGTGCNVSGTASLYGIKAASGAGALAGDRSMTVGSGIASTPIVSQKPGSGTDAPDLYVTISGAGQAVSTSRVDMNPPTLSNRTNMLFWRDRRVQ